MGFSPCSYLEHILFIRGADLPTASQERNERVDIEPLSTHERSRFVSGHDFSRAAHSPQRWALAPVPISSTFCSSRGADLPAASQEWNERVDIELLPTHERSRFVSGHDFSRAAHSPQRWALAPVPITSTFCSLGDPVPCPLATVLSFQHPSPFCHPEEPT